MPMTQRDLGWLWPEVAATEAQAASPYQPKSANDFNAAFTNFRQGFLIQPLSGHRDTLDVSHDDAAASVVVRAWGCPMRFPRLDI
jgi:hypothetical protein